MKEFDLDTIKETEAYLLKMIQDVVNNLNIIEEMVDSIGIRQSKVDSLLSDYVHLLEENNTNKKELSNESYIRIAKEIEANRKKRRHLKNEYEIARVYMEQKEKLLYKEHRQFFINEIHRRFTELNQPYKPRILTENEVENLLSMQNQEEKPKYHKSEKSEFINQRIKDLLDLGYSQTRIANELGISQPSVSIRVSKMKNQEG